MNATARPQRIRFSLYSVIRSIWLFAVVLLLMNAGGSEARSQGKGQTRVDIFVLKSLVEGIPGAKVEISGRVFTTGAAGKAVGYFPPGTYKLTVTLADQPEAKIDSVALTYGSPGGPPQPVPDQLGSVNFEVPTPDPTGEQWEELRVYMRPGEEHLPIIFLPGVAGSELKSGAWEVWATSSVGNRFDLELGADGKTSARGANITVGDVLRRGDTNFYGSFIESLKAMGYKDGIDLIRFPYDWRYSNDDDKLFAQLDQLIKTLLSTPGKRKVILISHSMGGIIARAYVYSSAARAATVDSFITMGTPYLGAPKPYYGLVNGYTFGNPSVNPNLMKFILQNYPSAYQLLPQKSFIKDTASNRDLGVDEANTIQYKWFTNIIGMGPFEDNYIPTTDNVRFFNPGLLAKAKQFWSLVLDTNGNLKPLPGGVKQYVIIGYGVSTLGGYNLEDWKPGILPVWPFSGSYLELPKGKKVVLHPISTDGDGTVPLWSANTPAATAKYYIPYKSATMFTFGESSSHADLPSNKTVQSIVAQIIDYESGLSKDKPDPGQYPGPSEYMGQEYNIKLVELEDLAQFELHSDAHLRVSLSSGKALGFNNAGGIDETLPGTFLSMDGAEYASIADLNLTLKVTVTGIRQGKFTLDVNVKRAGSKVARFSYREVPVKQGTVAEVTMSPAQVSSAPPPLTVTIDGRTIIIPASIGNAGGPLIPQGGAPIPTGPLPPITPPSGGIGGTWIAPTGDIIELVQNGNRVTGSYRGVLGTGDITGTFDGRTLNGTLTVGQAGIVVTQSVTLRFTDDGKLEGQVGSPLFNVNLILTRR